MFPQVLSNDYFHLNKLVHSKYINPYMPPQVTQQGKKFS
jgi:hypothetical protein